MSVVAVEVEEWVDLPDVEAIVERAAIAALDAPPLGELAAPGPGHGPARGQASRTEGVAPRSAPGAAAPSPYVMPAANLSAAPSVASGQRPQRGSICGSVDSPLEIAILLTSDDAVRAMNFRFRGKDAATNVLSFPAPQSAWPHLGDIALAAGVCRREADAQNKPLAHHVMHLTVHGVLHLLGYDHESDAEAEVMEGLERAILADLGVFDPYARPGDGVVEANA